MFAPVVAAPITPDDGFGTETFVSVEKLGSGCSVLRKKICENRPLRRTRSTTPGAALHFSQRTRPLRRRELLSFILHGCSGHYLSNRNCLLGRRRVARRKQIREQSRDRQEAAGKQLKHQRAKKQVTHGFALRVRHVGTSRRMGSDFGGRHHQYPRPRNCATQVIVLTYQTLHRRAPASAAVRPCPGDDAGSSREAAPKNLGCHLPTAQRTGHSVGSAVTPDGK